MDIQLEVQKIMHELDVVLRTTSTANILDGVAAVKSMCVPDEQADWNHMARALASK